MKSASNKQRTGKCKLNFPQSVKLEKKLGEEEEEEEILVYHIAYTQRLTVCHAATTRAH